MIITETQRFVYSLPALTFVKMFRRLAPQFYGAASMAFAVWLLGMVLPNSWSYATHLALQVAFGAIAYWIFIHSFLLGAYTTVPNVVASYFQQN